LKSTFGGLHARAVAPKRAAVSPRPWLQRAIVASATLRQWHLLTLLPVSPRRADTATLAAQLAERGLVVHRRTVQRDLLELSKLFPIVSDERAKPYGWRWRDDAGLLAEQLARLRAIYDREP